MILKDLTRFERFDFPLRAVELNLLAEGDSKPSVNAVGTRGAHPAGTPTPLGATSRSSPAVSTP